MLAPSRKEKWLQVRPDALDNPLLKIYDCVREPGLPNMLASCISVLSQLNYLVWESVATGHFDDRYILDGIRFGFPLHYAGPMLDRPNRDSHSSANQFADQF